MRPPEPARLIPMLVTVHYILKGDSNSIQEEGTGKIKIGAFLALMNFLDDSFQLGMLWSGRVDEIVAGLRGIKLLLAEVEGVVVALDEFFQAGIVHFIVEVRVDSPLVVEIEQPQDVHSLNHNQTVKPQLAEVQKILVLFEINPFVDLLEEDAAIARVGLAVADDFSVPLGEN